MGELVRLTAIALTVSVPILLAYFLVVEPAIERMIRRLLRDA